MGQTARQAGAPADATPVVAETYGDLSQLLAREPEGTWPSRVNPNLTHSQSLGILRRAVAAFDQQGRYGDTLRGNLLANNVLRECRHRHGDMEAKS